jgi:CheY-like chemotaxis protein
MPRRRGTGEARQVAVLDGKTVLYVDDEPDTKVVKFLRDSGATVLLAHDLDEAVSQAKDAAGVDSILMDIVFDQVPEGLHILPTLMRTLSGKRPSPYAVYSGWITEYEGDVGAARIPNYRVFRKGDLSRDGDRLLQALSRRGRWPKDPVDVAGEGQLGASTADDVELDQDEDLDLGMKATGGAAWASVMLGFLVMSIVALAIRDYSFWLPLSFFVTALSAYLAFRCAVGSPNDKVLPPWPPHNASPNNN